MSISLKITDLSCKRGDIRVLHGVSFTMQAGQCFLLKGANGSGKTTLLRTLAGFQNPLSGLFSASHPLAFLTDQNNLNGTLTLWENLNFWAELYQSPQFQIDEILAKMELLPYKNYVVRKLSLGLKRRAAFCRLLLQKKAKIWLLDEPISGLDQASVARLAEEITAFTKTDGIVLMASHEAMPIHIDKKINLNIYH